MVDHSTSTLDTTTTLNVGGTDTAPDLDPGVFAIGFQELDLSTEALLYSTGTSREDAWCLAIFAALGERAVQYEKVMGYLTQRYIC